MWHPKKTFPCGNLFFFGCIESLPDWKYLKIAYLAYSHAKLWPQGTSFALSGCFNVMSDNFKGIYGSKNNKKSDFFFTCRSGKFSTWCVTPQKNFSIWRIFISVVRNFYCPDFSLVAKSGICSKKLESKNSWAIFACPTSKLRWYVILV